MKHSLSYCILEVRHYGNILATENPTNVDMESYTSKYAHHKT